MPHLVTIDAAADLTGLDPEDIEYAEQLGMLAAGREAEGMYSARQMKMLQGIARLRQLGLSIDDIRELDLSEEVLSDIRDYLGAQAEVRPQPDVSRRCLSATISILEGHARALSEQIGQLDKLRRSLEDRIGAFHKLLDTLEGRVRKAA